MPTFGILPPLRSHPTLQTPWAPLVSWRFPVMLPDQVSEILLASTVDNDVVDDGVVGNICLHIQDSQVMAVGTHGCAVIPFVFGPSSAWVFFATLRACSRKPGVHLLLVPMIMSVCPVL